MIAPEQLALLVEKSDSQGWVALCRHVLALILLLIGAVILPNPFSGLSWFGYALVLTFVFCPLHEAIHETAFATRGINRLVGFVFGLVLLLPPRYFRAFHMAHHRHTQIPGRDPELATPKPRTRRQYFWHVTGIPYWRSQLRAMIRYAGGNVDDFVPVSKRPALIREARVFLSIYAMLLLISWVSGSLALWWFWVLPLLVGQPFLRWFLLAEHTGCPEVTDMLDNTRTTLTNSLIQRLCWNMNFHTAHHAYAGIPFHRLPDVNTLLASRLTQVAQGYVAVNRDIYRSLT